MNIKLFFYPNLKPLIFPIELGPCNLVYPVRWCLNPNIYILSPINISPFLPFRLEAMMPFKKHNWQSLFLSYHSKKPIILRMIGNYHISEKPLRMTGWVTGYDCQLCLPFRVIADGQRSFALPRDKGKDHEDRVEEDTSEPHDGFFPGIFQNCWRIGNKCTRLKIPVGRAVNWVWSFVNNNFLWAAEQLWNSKKTFN